MFYKVSEQGTVIECTYMTSKNAECPIEKLNADEYIVRSEGTGEVHEFEHGDSRLADVNNVRRTFRRLRAIINTNCTPDKVKNLRWVTLTFKDAVTDTSEVYKHFKRFWQRFKYRYGKAEYIAVLEPHGEHDGREWHGFHIHVILIFPRRAPYIPNEELQRVWGLGYTDIRAVKGGTDNLGAYLSAYIGNVEVPADSDEYDVEAVVDGKRKKYIKGSRLGLYPRGCQIYRYSRGVKVPEERWVTPDELNGVIKGAALTYKAEYGYSDDDGFEQYVIKEFYNRARAGRLAPVSNEVKRERGGEPA